MYNNVALHELVMKVLIVLVVKMKHAGTSLLIYKNEMLGKRYMHNKVKPPTYKLPIRNCKFLDVPGLMSQVNKKLHQNV